MIALLVVTVVVVDAVMGERGLLALMRARRESEALIQSLAAQRAENARLREQVRRLHDDPAAIEELARRNLGLIRPGEKIFIIKDLKPTATP